MRGFDDAIWERERFAIVVEGSVHKFGQHAELRDYLLGTGDRVLVEASPLDRVWGIGLAADDERAHGPGALARAQPAGLRADGGAGGLRDSAGDGVDPDADRRHPGRPACRPASVVRWPRLAGEDA